MFHFLSLLPLFPSPPPALTKAPCLPIMVSSCIFFRLPHYNRTRALILQALRWRVTRARPGPLRASVIAHFETHDLLQLKAGDDNMVVSTQPRVPFCTNHSFHPLIPSVLLAFQPSRIHVSFLKLTWLFTSSLLAPPPVPQTHARVQIVGLLESGDETLKLCAARCGCNTWWMIGWVRDGGSNSKWRSKTNVTNTPSPYSLTPQPSKGCSTASDRCRARARICWRATGLCGASSSGCRAKLMTPRHAGTCSARCRS